MQFSPPGDERVDTHVTIVPYFTVPDDKMDEFKCLFPAFYAHTRSGTGATKDCLYYGFAQEGYSIFCREGYTNAAGVLAHLAEVDVELKKAVALVGPDGLKLSVMGPADELVFLQQTPQTHASFGNRAHTRARKHTTPHTYVKTIITCADALTSTHIKSPVRVHCALIMHC